jgi:hypothetical protein
MSTLGIRPGDAVLVIEHRGEQLLVYNALVAAFSMDERLAGTRGEPAIEACFVATYWEARRARQAHEPLPTLTVPRVVHISHRDFIEGRAGLGYEELPGPIPGICRYCKCTERRGCRGGCTWLDQERTVCSTQLCMARFAALENLNSQVVGEVMGAAIAEAATSLGFTR